MSEKNPICVYTLGENYFSFHGLMKHYYKRNRELKNHNIYSTDEIIDSTVNIIKNASITINEAGSLLDRQGKKVPALTDIVSGEYGYLVQKLGIDLERFAPEYNEEQRKLAFIKDKLIEGGISREEIKDKTIRELASYDSTSDYLKEIEEIIEVEEKSNELMNSLKRAVKISIEHNSDTFEAEDELRKAVLKAVDNGLILPGKEGLLLSALNQFLKSIVNTIYTQGTPIADIIIPTGSNVSQEMVGHFDIIVVDSDGNAHIYAIKSSKRDFQHWDSAKKLNTDYQLAFQRALLGQYLTINKTSLNIIPIELGSIMDGKFNPKFLKIGQLETRNADPKAGLQYRTGKLFQIANAIIPYTSKIAPDSDRKDKIMADLGLLIPDYKIKTTSRKLREEDIVANIKKHGFYIDNVYVKEYGESNQVDSDAVVKGNRLYLVNGLTMPLEELEKKARALAKNYLNFVDTTINRNVVSLKAAINNSINQGKGILLYNDAQAAQAQVVLGPYLTPNYRVLDAVEELDALGIILLQNRSTGDIVTISISSWNFLSKYNKEYSYKEVEYFKIFTVLNNLYKDLNLDVSKIQDIILFDLEGRTSPTGDIRTLFESYKELAKSKSYSLAISKDTLPTFYDVVSKTLKGVLDTYNGPNKEGVLQVFRELDGNFSNVDVDTIMSLMKNYEEQNPGLNKKVFENTSDFKKPDDYVYVLLKSMLLAKYGLVPEGDILKLRDYALKTQDAFGIISSLYSTDLEEYNKAGEKILGLIGGLKTVTPDRVPSKDLFNINQMISTTIDLMRQEIYKKSAKIRASTKKYFKNVGYGGVERHVVGNYRKVNEPLWVMEGGKISSKWMVKNPYDATSGLSPDQAEYLKEVLFMKNREQLYIPNDVADKIDFSSLEKMKATTPDKTFQLLLHKMEVGDYFKMPLIRSQSWTRHQKVFSTSAELVKKGIKGIKAEVIDFIDNRHLYPEDRNIAQKDIDYYNKMYEIYGQQSEEFISNSVNENGPELYEIDLDAIVTKIIHEKTKKRYVDKVLPIINAYVWWIKLTGGRANKEIDKALTHIRERIDIGFYDQPIIDPEFEEAITAVSAVKSITTPLMLALRPAIFLKELSLGLFRGISITATQFFGKDQFSYKEYFSALKEVFTLDKALSTDFNKPHSINNFYGFANMDINSYANKMKTNRRVSMFNGVGPWMYSMNTMPDFFNRMVLFIAKMKADGSYDAHTLNGENVIVYDATKDERFSYYLANRHLYKDVAGNFTSAKNDEKFNYQRQMYLLVMNEINAENETVGNEIFTENGNLIDKAYSEKERSSFKSFTDSVYGYYDKENSPAWHYGTFGLVFLQFMQFWPGKMRTWFGRPTSKENKVIGQHRQRVDAQGNKLWLKHNEDGTTEEVTENTGVPVLEWTGLPHEGIVYSMAKTINATWTGLFDPKKTVKEEWDTLEKNDEMVFKRIKYGLADGVLMGIFFKLIYMMLQALWEPGEDGELGEEARQLALSINKKTIAESNLWSNTYGALNSDPAFMTYSLKALNDVKNVFDGDKTIQQFLGNIGALETLRDPARLAGGSFGGAGSGSNW